MERDDVILRLSEIRKIIEENLPNINIETKPIDNSKITIINIFNSIDAIKNLSVLPFFKDATNNVIQFTEISASRLPQTIISTPTYGNFNTAVSELIRLCETILNMIDSIQSKQPDNLICIKMSDNIINISEIKQLTDNLNDTFKNVIGLKKYPGEIKFYGVESGTNWIDFIITGAPFIPLIYGLIQVAYEAANDFYQAKILKQKYQATVIQNNIDEENSKVLSSINRTILSKQQEDGTLDVDTEELNRLILASTALSQSIIDGNKVLLSIEAPKEKQNNLISSAKQLETNLEDIKRLQSPPKESPDEPASDTVSDEPTSDDKPTDS